MLSQGAFNALLKTLEEPPPHVKFVLATTDVHKVPETILSRCQRFDFRRLTLPQIADQLGKVAAEEGMTLSAGALALVARQAEGGMRDALSLLDQVRAACGDAPDDAAVAEALGAVDAAAVSRIAAALVGRDGAAVLAEVEALHARGLEMKRLAEELVRHLRNVVVAKLVPAAPLDLPDAELAEVRAQAGGRRRGAAHAPVRPRPAGGGGREARRAAALRARGGAARGRVPRARRAGVRAPRPRRGAGPRRAASAAARPVGPACGGRAGRSGQAAAGRSPRPGLRPGRARAGRARGGPGRRRLARAAQLRRPGLRGWLRRAAGPPPAPRRPGGDALPGGALARRGGRGREGEPARGAGAEAGGAARVRGRRDLGAAAARHDGRHRRAAAAGDRGGLRAVLRPAHPARHRGGRPAGGGRRRRADARGGRAVDRRLGGGRADRARRARARERRARTPTSRRPPGCWTAASTEIEEL